MNGRHMQRGVAITILYVRVCPCLNEQLHTKSTMGREGSVVQWSLSLVVEGIEVHPVVEQCVHHHILTIVTSHMESCAVEGIWSIHL